MKLSSIKKLYSISLLSIAAIVFTSEAQWSRTAPNVYLSTSSDNVVVGSGTAESKLDVRGSAIIQNTPGGNTSDLSIKRTGALSSSNISFAFSDRSTNQDLWLYAYDGTTFKNFIGFNYPTQTVAFPAGGNTLFINEASGNIGIGTASPSQYTKLNVNYSGPNGCGILAVSSGSDNSAISGQATGLRSIGVSGSAVGVGSGISGTNSDPTGWAGSFYGRVYCSGTMAIGTQNPGTSYKLAVEGKIGAREIVVTTAAWADHVFKPEYNLKPLSEVEKFITTNKHLEGIPTAKEVKSNGVAVGDMQVKLLQKVEELTLYMIELKKENQALQTRVKDLETVASK